MTHNPDRPSRPPTKPYGDAGPQLRTLDILARLAQRSSALADPEFYRACVRDLADYYAVRVVRISLFSDITHSRLRTLLYWADGGFQDNYEYSLSGTPCQSVLDSRQQNIPEQVAVLYPRDAFLVARDMQSYFGVPLGEPHSDIAGVIAILHDRPLNLSDEQQSVLRVFAARITAELNWQQRPEQVSRQELEYEVASLGKDLGVAYGELNGLYDVVNHDLRVPLRSVCGFSEAVLEELDGTQDSELIRDYCERIHKASLLMNEQIESLAQLRRVSNTQIMRTPVDLSRLVNDVVNSLRESGRYAHAVQCEIAADLRVEGDRYLLKEMLTQLLDNAWKFTADRERPRVRIYRESQGGQEVYVVEDNGIGFDMRYANKLFTLFHKLHHDIRYTGHGIGLTLVHRVVRRHGGNIWAESTLGEGSRFCFTLPSESSR